jgi:type VI secretion system protein ImpL
MRVEEQLRAGDQPEAQYEALKAYLMMYDPERFEPASLKAHVEADWDVRLGARDEPPSSASALTQPSRRLLAQGAGRFAAAAGQGAGRCHAYAALAAVPLAQRVYNRLRQRGLGSDFPEFTVAKAGGGNAPLVFVRASGQPLTRGVPGLFTFNGYHKGFQSGGRRRHSPAGRANKAGCWASRRRTACKSPQAPLLASNAPGRRRARLYLNEYRDSLWKTSSRTSETAPMTSIEASRSSVARFPLGAGQRRWCRCCKAMSRETTLLAGNTCRSIKA